MALTGWLVSCMFLINLFCKHLMDIYVQSYLYYSIMRPSNIFSPYFRSKYWLNIFRPSVLLLSGESAAPPFQVLSARPKSADLKSGRWSKLSMLSLWSIPGPEENCDWENDGKATFLICLRSIVRLSHRLLVQLSWCCREIVLQLCVFFSSTLTLIWESTHSFYAKICLFEDSNVMSWTIRLFCLPRSQLFLRREISKSFWWLRAMGQAILHHNWMITNSHSFICKDR